MRMSQLFGRTLREAPAEAETANHQLMLRGGLIVQLSAGVYSFMPLAWRAIRNAEQIVREEMEAAGAQELRMPAIQPLELWQETGRDVSYGPVLFQVVDRRERQMVLAPTHEEAVTDLFRKTAQSYRDLPQRVFQMQTKFRDEPRPRGGLIRVREFIMKDCYSFDRDEEAFQASYEAMRQAYLNVFQRCNVDVVPVQADSGAIGGKQSEEFIFLTEIGEDTIALCRPCGYAANQERAEFDRGDAPAEEPQAVAEVATPGATTIAELAEQLGIPESKTAKAAFFVADGRPVFAVIRGDLEVNELKLLNTLGASEIRAMSEAEVGEQGWVAGYASPVGLDGVTAVADISIADAPNLVAGANREGFHLRNVNHGRDWTATEVADIGLAREGDPCPAGCGGAIEMHRGVELGHIFRLGTIYAEPMDAGFLDEEGEKRLPIMGCYGLGIERTMAAVIEANHDEAGIRWPASVCPYDVHIVAIGADEPDIAQALEAVERSLAEHGFSVLSDDRDERPGVKFNDADLLGMPVRLTVSPRNLKQGQIELKRRDAAEAELLPQEDVVEAVRTALAATSPTHAPGAE